MLAWLELGVDKDVFPLDAFKCQSLVPQTFHHAASQQKRCLDVLAIDIGEVGLLDVVNELVIDGRDRLHGKNVGILRLQRP